jgi:beta-glucanase (GH16 family)
MNNPYLACSEPAGSTTEALRLNSALLSSNDSLGVTLLRADMQDICLEPRRPGMLPLLARGGPSRMRITTLSRAAAPPAALAIALVVPGPSPPHGLPTAAQPRQQAWTAVWSDNFTGPRGQGVDQRLWKYDTGTGVFGTGEVETMTSSTSNVALDGKGDLDITAIRDGTSWTSGRIQTTATFTPRPGGEMMVSASIEQPAPPGGDGYWPAFWLLGTGTWPASGEIDIMEDVNAASRHSGTLHCGNLTQHNPDGTTGPCHEPVGLTSGLLPCSQCQSGFHTYSVVIDRRNPADEQIDWLLDGQQFYSVTEAAVGTSAWTQAVDHGFSIILDLAIGGSYPDAACTCTTPDNQTSPGGTLIVHDVTVSSSP